MTLNVDPVIANQALDLAMEWGQHWMQPTQARLSHLRPNLAPAELDAYDSVAREAMRAGHHSVYELVSELGPDSKELHARWQREYLVRYPWVSSANLSRLFSQGMYYAMKRSP